MAASFTLTSGSYQGRQLRLYCTQTKDIANNKSTINWTLISEGGSSNYYTTGPTKVYINGTEVYSKGVVTWNSYAFPAAKGSVSGSLPVSHNNDGKKTISVSFSTAIYHSTVYTYSGNWTLDDIPRQANLTSAPNFNDEQNPTITYSNPAGDVVSSLRVCLANNDMNNVYADWRDISKTDTSYTFNLTEAERNKLRNATINSNTMTVRFMIETVISGITYYNNIPKTLTIVNASPTLNPTVKDVGEGSLSLTGDENKIIKGFNYIEYTSGASAKKGASIVSQKVVCGSKTATNGNDSFTDVDSASFVFSVTDSRGNTTTQTINKTLIDYVKLTCNIGDKKPDVNGNMKVECSGNYFNGSFGAVANTLNVQYRYKVQGGEYSDWTNMTITKDGNTYTAEAYLTGLNYQTTYVFQTKAVDKISWEGVLTEEIIVRSYPVFDWGKNDFRFNVDAHGWFSSDVKDLPDGDGDRVYWRDLKAGTYWYDLDRMNIGEMPDLWGFVEKKGYIGADYSVMFYTQPEGAIFRRSGNIHNDSGWLEINTAKVLYNNSSGNSGTVTLNDSVENYKYIDIWFFGNNYSEDYTRVHNPHNKPVNLFTGNCATDLSNIWIQAKQIQISATTITNTSSGEVAFNSASVVGLWETPVRIKKVVGYR